jgi:DNA-binding NarL/FixJ family response regulator
VTRLRVLIADDNRLFTESLASILAADGRFDVVGRARNGREAVALAAALEPEVILMDLEMPVMDGVEATRSIMQHTSARVIVLTSSDSSSQLARARGAGAAGYLRKDLMDWSELIARALSEGGSAAA